MPPKKETGNEPLMAAIRDSNRWAELEERKDYQDRMRTFTNAYAGMASANPVKDKIHGRVLNVKPPTKPPRRTKLGDKPSARTARRHGSMAWVEGEIYPQIDVDPYPFNIELNPPVGKDFRPRDRRSFGENVRWGTEEFPRNSMGPRVNPDRLSEMGVVDFQQVHSSAGNSALRGAPRIQQTLMDLPHARSAAVNSVLHYVLDSHAPKTSQ